MGMSREEAIKIIKECKEKGFKRTYYTVNEFDTAVDMAIKALRREDTFLDKVLEIIDMGDTINTDNKTCIEKLVKVLNDYLDDKETATQMEEAIGMAIYLLAEEE